MATEPEDMTRQCNPGPSSQNPASQHPQQKLAPTTGQGANARSAMANTVGPVETAIEQLATNAMSIVEKDLYNTASHPDTSEFAQAIASVLPDIYSGHQDTLRQELLDNLTATLETGMDRAMTILQARVREQLPPHQKR